MEIKSFGGTGELTISNQWYQRAILPMEPQHFAQAPELYLHNFSALLSVHGSSCLTQGHIAISGTGLAEVYGGERTRDNHTDQGIHPRATDPSDHPATHGLWERCGRTAR